MKDKHFELRLACASWGTGVRAKNYREAIKKFLSNPIYHFKPREYTIEINRKFTVKTVLKEIVTFNFKNKILKV